jgi:acyl carrier protein
MWEQAGIGMTSQLTAAAIERMRRYGVAAMSVEDGLRLLDDAVARPAAHWVPIKLQLDVLRQELARGARVPPLMSWLLPDAPEPDGDRDSLTASDAYDALCRILAAPIRGHVVVSADDLPERVQRSRAVRVADAAPVAPSVAPSGTVEETIATTWRDVLGVERVGVHDDFFELGGDSLLGTKVVARLQKSFGVAISMRHLWKNASVSKLAMVIEELIIDQLLEAAAPEEVRDGEP